VKLLNERTRVKDAIKQWIESHGLTGSYSADRRGRHVGKELSALDQETATAKDVAEIIGNNSWAGMLTCDECGKEAWDLVQLGEEPDYESSTASICVDCLKKAVELIENER
jgi:hypothetical protein